jgi:Tol biopolymer transport system component
MKSRVRLRQIIPTSALFVLSFGLVSAAPAQQPATPLGIFEAHSDVGITPKPGSATYDPATAEYRVTGGGANMWAGVDAFHFVWKKVNGDFDLNALVHLVGAGAEDHRKAALVVRQSLDPNSAYADVAVHGDGLTALQFRPVAGAETAEVRSPVSAPGSILLSRRGAQLTMSARSAAGTDPFVPSGPVTLEFTGPVYVGLGVCSHDANVLETAVFSKVVLRELPATTNNLNPTRVHSDLSVYDLTTKTVSVVYSADTLWEAPNWTPDGKYLMANSGGKLYRIDVNGKARPERVGLDASYEANNDHGLSPDGKWLAISAEHGGAKASQVYVADANGGNPRLITPQMPSYFHGWSPDGKWLAFVGERNNNFDIYRIPVTGGEEERLTTDPGFDDGPDYSRGDSHNDSPNDSKDGKWIYINSNRAGGWDIWRFPADGAGPGDSKAERITNDAQQDWFPHPSPDGRWIAFLSFPPGTPGHDTKTSVHLRMMPASQPPVPAVSPAGSAIEDWSDSIQILTEFFGGQGTINVNSWSPDSKKFAFVSYRLLP